MTYMRALRHGAALLAAVCCFIAYVAPALAAGYYPSGTWDTVKTLSAPQDMVMSMGGELFVADTSGRRIVVYAADTGEFLREFDGSDVPGGDLEHPVALTIGPDANIYVLDQTDGDLRGGRIAVFTNDGALIRWWGAWGTADGQMRGPQDIAFGPTGDVYIADTFNNRIQIFTAAGVHKRSVGATLAAPLSSPVAIAFRSGETYVAEMNAGQVRVFTSAWVEARKWGISTTSPYVTRYTRLAGLEWDTSSTRLLVADAGTRKLIEWCNPTTTNGSVTDTTSVGLNQPEGMLDSAAGLYVADAADNRIVRYVPSGETTPTTFAPLASDIAAATEPKGVVIEPSTGDVFVTEAATSLVKKYDSSGALVMTFTPPPASSFASPTGIAVSRDVALRDEVYICDTGHDRILVYSTDGTFLTQFGSTGTGDLEFNAPSAVTVAIDGTLFIADTGNNRVQNVTPDGTFQYYLATSGLSAPAGIVAAPDGRTFVSDTGGGRIRVYSGGGTLLKTMSAYGSEDGYLFGPAGLALTSAGELVVADRGNNRIQWFNATTYAYVRKFGSRGSCPGGLFGPSSVAASGAVEILIADTGNNRIGWARYDASPPSTVATGDVEVWVSRPATVTLERTDADSGVWQTYYRIGEGSTQLYSAPFTVDVPDMDDTTTTVSFWSIDRTGNVEATKTAYVLTDHVAPKGSVMFGTGDQTVFPQRRLSVTSSFGLTAREMRVGTADYPGAWVPYQTDGEFDLSAEGTITLLAAYRDAAHNTTTVAFPCVVDGTGPTTSIARNPASGVGTETVEVTLSAEDARSSVAQKWFKVDGGPNRLYTAPFGVTGAGISGLVHTVDAWSIDEVGNVGTTETIQFGITPLARGGVLTLHGGDDFVGPDVINVDRFTLLAATTIQGAQTTRYDAGFGPVTQPSSSEFWPTFPATEGTHTLSVEFEDSIGTTWTLSDSVYLDLTKPVTTIHGVEEGVAYPRAVEVSFTADDVSPITQTEYWVNGDGPHVYSGPFTLGDDDSYHLEYRSTDDAGNIEDAQALDFIVAAIPPSGTMQVAGDRRYVGSTEVTVESTMTRANHMRFDIGSGYGDFELYAYAKTLTFPGEGDYMVVGSFINTAGVETTLSVPVQVDLTEPVTTIDGVEEGVAYAHAALVSFDAVDSSPATTEYWINGDGPHVYSEPFYVDEEGAFRIAFRSTDVCGNVEETQTVDFEMAMVPPYGTMLVAGGARYVNTVGVLVEPSMSHVWAMRFDIGDGYGIFEPYGDTKTLTFPGEGDYDVVGSFINTAGVETTLSVPVQVDLTEPVTTVHGVQQGASYQRAVEVSFTTDDLSPIAHTQYWLDAVGPFTYSAPFTYGPDDRDVVLRYHSRDEAGNVETTRTLIYTVAVPPVTSVSGVPAGWSATDVVVAFDASDGPGSGIASLCYAHGEEPPMIVGTSSDITTVSQEGTTVVSYRAIDASGNAEATKTATVRIDKTAPARPASLSYSSLTASSATLSWSSVTNDDGLSPIAGYRVFDNGAPVADVEETTVRIGDLALGTEHVISVRAQDEAGNLSEATEYALTMPTRGDSVEVDAGSVNAVLVVEVAGDGNSTDEGTATVEIADVTKAGTLSIVRSDNPLGDAAAGYRFVDDFFVMSFDGEFAGNAIITLPFDSRMPESRALGLGLQQLIGDTWVPVTPEHINYENRTITFVLDSFSPIALVEPVGTSAAAFITASVTSSVTVYPPYRTPGTFVLDLWTTDDSGRIPLDGFVVTLQRFSGGSWTDAATAIPSTDTPGSYVVTATCADDMRTVFRATLDDNWLYAAQDTTLTMVPHASLTKPSPRATSTTSRVMSSTRTYRSFYVKGRIYRTGHRHAKLQVYKYSSTRRKYVLATTKSIATNTRGYYSLKTSIHGRGKYRFRAYIGEDKPTSTFARTYSPYSGTVTVR